MWATEIVSVMFDIKTKNNVDFNGLFSKCITGCTPILRVCGTIIIVDMYDDNRY